MRLVWGVALGVTSEAEGVQHLEVTLGDGVEGRALSYTALAGHCEPGDKVLLNTTAVDLGLGTGGVHFAVARLAGSQASAVLPGQVALDQPSGGHIMKLRYTPLQHDVCSVEEQASPHHAAMAHALDLAQMPVACCGLHSQVPLVAAAVKQAVPGLRVAYVMTDFGALPLALSEIVRASGAVGLIDTTITCGQAFGGELEAVNLHSGLLAARHVAHADVAIVAIGPGVVGTATPFGHGGVAQGEAINAAACLGGVPVATLRLSFADRRPRHHGVSHHTLSALATISLARARVAMPHMPEEYAEVIEEQLETAGVWDRHIRVQAQAGLDPPPDPRGVRVATMGRERDDDPAFFSAAHAAGEVCARIVRDGVVDR